jgi:hypothetical protein
MLLFIVFIKKSKNYYNKIMTQNFTFANIDNSNDDPVLVVTDLEKKLAPYIELILFIANLFLKRCHLQICKMQRFFMNF